MMPARVRAMLHENRLHMRVAVQNTDQFRPAVSSMPNDPDPLFHE